MALKEGGHTFTKTGVIIGIIGYAAIIFIIALPFIFH